MMSLKMACKKARKPLLSIFMVVVICGSLMLGWGSVAQAANQAGAVVQEQAEREFDRMRGAGSAEQLENQAGDVFNDAQRRIDNTFDSDIEGAAKQVRGKVQQDISQTQRAADDAADSAEGFLDKVKSFFN